MSGRRALHFVFKVGNRPQTAKFYRDVLGMKILRHEEFEEGCKAACNGPFDGKWSKSMVGYGPEDDHFVVELTYNYGLGSYKLGNDFRMDHDEGLRIHRWGYSVDPHHGFVGDPTQYHPAGLTVHSTQVLENAKTHNWPILQDGAASYIAAPDGHRFYVINDQTTDPVQKVSLSSSNLQRSIEYWRDGCGMTLFSQEGKTATLGFSEDQCRLELVDIGEKVDHGTASGRIAFGCPAAQLPEIEACMKAANETILTPFISLDTPGKATVQVVILADPDGHEICFVGDEGFRELSQVDPKADELLDKAISEDKSDEWYAKKGKTKAAAK